MTDKYKARYASGLSTYGSWLIEEEQNPYMVAHFFGDKAEARARKCAADWNEEYRLGRASIDKRVTVKVIGSGVEVMVDGLPDTYFCGTTAVYSQDAEERVEVLRERLWKAQD